MLISTLELNEPTDLPLSERIEVLKEEARESLELPMVRIFKDEKACVLYCNDELFNFIKKYVDKNNLEEVGLVEVGKIWFQIKKILKGGIVIK